MSKSLVLWPWVFIVALIALAIAPSVPTALPPVTSPINQADTAWVLAATALVLFMTPGLAFFYGGMVDRKHIISTMFQSFIAMGVIGLLWVVVGFSLAFGDSIGGVIGNPKTFFLFKDVGTLVHSTLSPTVPLMLFALFQMKFAIITPALVTGAFAERIRFKAFVTFMVLFALFVYAPLAHWTWHPDGILRKWGVLDFAGGTVVHMAAGFAGLAGALAVGRRRFKDKHGTNAINIPYVLLGTGMLWFGWFGFNAGSALAANEAAVSAFLTTNTAAAAAMVSWLLVDAAMGRKPSAMGAGIGAVVGLVAITPAAGFVNVAAAVIIGVVASLVSNLVVNSGLKARLDDTLDVFACHGVGGIVGMLLTAVFAASGGVVTGSGVLLGKHLLATLFVAAFSFVGSFVIYKIVSLVMSLRVLPHDEELGLDLSQHQESVPALAGA